LATRKETKPNEETLISSHKRRGNMKSRLIGPTAFGVAALITAGAIAPSVSGAAARPAGVVSATVHGTFSTFTDYAILVGPAASSRYNSELSGGAYHGGVSGAFTDYGTEIVGKNGSLTGWGTELCPVSCKIGGRKGGFSATYYYSGNGGTLTFTAGYGGLAGLTGGGTFFYPASGPPTYSYSYKL
jgi:hypothetical protein